MGSLREGRGGGGNRLGTALEALNNLNPFNLRHLAPLLFKKKNLYI